MMANLICKTVVSTKPILKSNMALPLWNMLQECLPDLQKELILGTISMKEMGILPPCDYHLVKILLPELDDVPKHCLRKPFF